jgi:hypothetical protein
MSAGAGTDGPIVQGTSAAVVGARQGAAGQTLDELMLAMDVVDTLRHQDALVARELDETRREAELIERLRGIYRGQGIEVTDDVIRQGVSALKESRFVYTPPPPGLGRTLALIWVRRGFYAKAFGAVLLALGLGIGGWYFAYERPRVAEIARQSQELTQLLPRALETGHREATAIAASTAGRERADQLLADGKTALARGNAAGARSAITGLEDLRARLAQSYRLIVFSRPGQPSGVWRLPPRQAADRGRNYYLIVEAQGADGQAIPQTIRNEEDGTTESVTRWGQRVSQQVYDVVAQDKRDDGVIQRNLVGEKKRGELDVTYQLPVVPGATITRW